MTIEAFAPAKINLTLHITGQRADGYHLLDSLVVFASVGDRLWLDPGPDLSLEVTGPFAKGVPTDARNLVWRAAELADWTGHIRLEKNLPHGAGIGGGSSDAAAVLRALKSNADGITLGADVPVCQFAKSARMRGVGEDVTNVDIDPLYAVLVNPGCQVPTPDVFRDLECRSNPPMPPKIPETSSELQIWLAEQRNDLEQVAIKQSPAIAEVLDCLSDVSDQYLTRMSGSGSTCFALFENSNAAQQASTNLARTHPNWWLATCELT